MKVILLGTPICPNCKKVAIELEEICQKSVIEYDNVMLSDAPKDILDIIISSGIKVAPVCFVWKDGDMKILVGDNIIEEFMKLI